MRLGAIVFLATLACPVQGQIASVPAGTLVRITAPSIFQGPLTGTLEAPVADTVFVSVRVRLVQSRNYWGLESRSVPRDAIERFEVSHGRSHGAGAKRGALIGLTVGGALGALLAFAMTSDDFFNAGNFPEIAGVTVTLAGVGTGALLGYARGVNGWKTVDPRLAQNKSHAWKMSSER